MSNWIQGQQELLLLCPRRKVHVLSGEQARGSAVMTWTLSLAAVQEAGRQCRSKNSRQSG